MYTDIQRGIIQDAVCYLLDNEGIWLADPVSLYKFQDFDWSTGTDQFYFMAHQALIHQNIADPDGLLDFDIAALPDYQNTDYRTLTNIQPFTIEDSGRELVMEVATNFEHYEYIHRLPKRLRTHTNYRWYLHKHAYVYGMLKHFTDTGLFVYPDSLKPHLTLANAAEFNKLAKSAREIGSVVTLNGKEVRVYFYYVPIINELLKRYGFRFFQDDFKGTYWYRDLDQRALACVRELQATNFKVDPRIFNDDQSNTQTTHQLDQPDEKDIPFPVLDGAVTSSDIPFPDTVSSSIAPVASTSPLPVFQILDVDIPENGRFPENKAPFPYQLYGVQWLARYRKTILADTKGLGKTAQVLFFINRFNHFPALFLCKADLKDNLRLESVKFLKGIRVFVASGLNCEIPPGYDLVIANLEILFSRNSSELSFTGQQLKEYGFQAGFVDECQRLKDKTTKTYAAVTNILTDVPNIGLLSASAAETRPSEFVGALELVDKLDDVGGWYRFITHYCGGFQKPVWYRKKNGVSGQRNIWVLDGWRELLAKATQEGRERALTVAQTRNQRLLELNQTLRRSGAYLRRNLRDLTTEDFGGRINPAIDPPSPVPVWFTIPATDIQEYYQAELDFYNWLAEFDFVFIKAMQSDSAKYLSFFNRLWFLSSKAKTRTVIDYVRDFLDAELKTIVFSYHREMTNALMSAYADQPSLNYADIEEQKRRFMENPDSDYLLICSLAAHHAGHTLTAAYHMVFGSLHWNSELIGQAFGRAYGRVNDFHSIVPYFVLALDTIDEDMWQIVMIERFTQMPAVLDGNLLAVTEAELDSDFYQSLTKRMVNRVSKRL